MDEKSIRDLFPELESNEVEVAQLNIEQFLRVIADFMEESVTT